MHVFRRSGVSAGWLAGPVSASAPPPPPHLCLNSLPLQHSRVIARSRSTTFFTSVRDCFFDTAEPPNTAWSILRSNSHRLDLLVPDKSRPKLLFFALDMNAGAD